MLPTSSSLSVGDVMPDWAMTDPDGKSFSFYTDSVAGNILVVLFSPDPDAGATSQLDRFLHRAAEFKAAGARIYFVTGSADQLRLISSDSIVGLVDHQQQIRQSLQPQGGPVTVVFRQNNHVAGVFDGDFDAQATNALATVRIIQTESATALMDPRHPPVLLVPEVFSPGECRELIDIFHTRGQVYLQEKAALDYIGGDYKMRVPEHMREDRVDHFFFEQTTLKFLSARISRVMPEILKVFQYRITKYESLRMACYRGARLGYRHAHRDKTSAHMHRRFAMSINLNTEEFQGGELRFPEFGDRRYRPGSGDAILFSSSLLHEALEVTAGTRFVFLAFLFGEY
jgi:peroxiredoxin